MTYKLERRVRPWKYMEGAVDKRLTGSELAAEWWRALHVQANLNTAFEDDINDEWYAEVTQAHDRSGVVLRFARLPHYDEEQP